MTEDQDWFFYYNYFFVKQNSAQHYAREISCFHIVEPFITSLYFQEHISYWIVRNSWGSSFGDNGYLYIKMGDNLCGEFKLKPFSLRSGQFPILTKIPNFILWSGKTKKHTLLCESKAGDKLTFVTGLCRGLVKSKGIYNLEEWCPQGKKRRGGCCVLCGFPSHAL